MIPRESVWVTTGVVLILTACGSGGGDGGQSSGDGGGGGGGGSTLADAASSDASDASEGGSTASGCPAAPPEFNAPCDVNGLSCNYAGGTTAQCEAGRWNLPSGPGNGGCNVAGSTCCDPFPGDGPNYCTGGLQCCANNTCAATCS